MAFSTGNVTVVVRPGRSLAAAKQRRGRSTVSVVVAVGTAALLAVVALVALIGSAPDEEPKGANPGALAERSKPASSLPAKPTAALAGGRAARPSRRAEALWQSPTSGAPIELAYLPPGTQAVLVWRVADFLRHPEAQKVLDSLGRLGDGARRDLVDQLGMPLEALDRLTIGLLDNEEGLPPLVLVAETTRSIDEEQLLAAWKNATVGEISGRRVYRRGEQVCFLPEEHGNLLVVAPGDIAAELVAQAGQPPEMRRELAELVAASDAQRHLTLLFTPNYWFAGGKGLLAGDAEKLKDPLAWFLGPQARAGLLSFHLANDFFAELRIYGSADEKPKIQERELDERWHAVPGRVGAYLGSLALWDYSREVLSRFPRMLELWAEYTRTTVEGRQIVLRAYLPGVAAHNLALGAQLALSAQAGPPAAIAGTAVSLGVAERLTKRISLSFPRQTLEKALELLAEEAGVQLDIIGADLQLEGITKNQSFGLDERDVPAAAVLRKIMRLANPDGKLVYVLKRPAAGADEMIVVTTRAAAAKRGDPLPPELQTGE